MQTVITLAVDMVGALNVVFYKTEEKIVGRKSRMFIFANQF